MENNKEKVIWFQKIEKWFKNMKRRYFYICCGKSMEGWGSGKYKCRECGKTYRT